MNDQSEAAESSSWKEELRTGLVLAGIALLMDVGYAAWRAVAATGVSFGARMGEFVDALLWPGVIIFTIAFVVMWLGWKLELD